MRHSTSYKGRILYMAAVSLSCFAKGFQLPVRLESPAPSAIMMRSTPKTRLQMNVLGEAWSTYTTYLSTAPLLTKCVTAGLIIPFGDLGAQYIESRKKQQEEGQAAGVDLGRALRFFIFGATLQPIWNHYWYQVLDSYLPPPDQWYQPVNALKIGLDQFVQAPAFTALAFWFLGTLEGKSLDNVKNQLSRDYVPTMLANWKVFLPATFINLAFLAPELRVGFVNIVFFGWSIYLSLVINSKEQAASKS